MTLQVLEWDSHFPAEPPALKVLCSVNSLEEVHQPQFPALENGDNMPACPQTED
jgi:hypothetical protein